MWRAHLSKISTIFRRLTSKSCSEITVLQASAASLRAPLRPNALPSPPHLTWTSFTVLLRSRSRSAARCSRFPRLPACGRRGL